jgi:hypothetical protein
MKYVWKVLFYAFIGIEEGFGWGGEGLFFGLWKYFRMILDHQ